MYLLRSKIFVRSGDTPSQTVYQFQKKAKKCKNLRSYGVASGANALSYMSFVAAVITLVININNNINANNNNNNQVNLNFGNNNNLITNLNQNVGNNFNLMFPPGRRRRRSIPNKSEIDLSRNIKQLMTKPSCDAHLEDDEESYNRAKIVLASLQGVNHFL